MRVLPSCVVCLSQGSAHAPELSAAEVGSGANSIAVSVPAPVRAPVAAPAASSATSGATARAAPKLGTALSAGEKEKAKLSAKDRTKHQRLAGQTGLDHREWRSEEEMRLRQQFD